MLYALVGLVACLGAAKAREPLKPFKTMPTISNSLVNLGKMGISFYFNSKLPEQQSTMDASPPNFFHKSEPEPCPCMAMKNYKNFPNPADILHKILSNEVPTSMACCDSHEQIQEEAVFFELGPKQSQTDLSVNKNNNPLQTNALPILPMLFDNLIPNKQSNFPLPIKPKAIEIFFFPKKKDNTAQDINSKLFPKKKNDNAKKSDIQIVGDKELRNDFKTYKFRPIPPMSSIKKDLAAVEKTDAVPITTDVNTEEPSTTIYTNSNSNNTI